jgi:hypothetical protein
MKSLDGVEQFILGEEYQTNRRGWPKRELSWGKSTPD